MRLHVNECKNFLVMSIAEVCNGYGDVYVNYNKYNWTNKWKM